MPRSGNPQDSHLPALRLREGDMPLLSERDLRVGESVTINARRYFVYDADGSTRRFFNDYFGEQLAEAIDWRKRIWPNFDEIPNAGDVRQRAEVLATPPATGILPPGKPASSYGVDKLEREERARKLLSYGGQRLNFPAR